MQEEDWISWKPGDGELKTHPLSIVDLKYSQKSGIERCVKAYNACTAHYSGLYSYRIVQEHPATCE